MTNHTLTIAMLSIHSSPLGTLGTRDTGGMSVYVLALAQEFGRHGHQVDIFTYRRYPEEPTVSSLAPKVRLVTMDINRHGQLSKADLYPHAGDFVGAMEAFRKQEGCTYNLIHSHYWVSGHVGRMVCKHWQLPHVITFHTLGALKAFTGVGRGEPDIRLQVEKELVQDTDGILAPCHLEKANLIH